MSSAFAVAVGGSVEAPGLARRAVGANDPTLPPPAPPTGGDASGGWGLFLVNQIAARWGVCPAPGGT
jgi:hypothetical protein